MQKVVNITVLKNNTFHQLYPFTTFKVIFYHPSGLTELPSDCDAPGDVLEVEEPEDWMLLMEDADERNGGLGTP